MMRGAYSCVLPVDEPPCTVTTGHDRFLLDSQHGFVERGAERLLISSDRLMPGHPCVRSIRISLRMVRPPSTLSPRCPP